MQDEVIIDIENPKDNDAISREDALNSLIKNTDFEGWELSQALEAIEKLPSVTQKSNFCASCKHNTDNEICLECEYDGITRGMTRYESVM